MPLAANAAPKVGMAAARRGRTAALNMMAVGGETLRIDFEHVLGDELVG